jgi:hypothetical protein
MKERTDTYRLTKKTQQTYDKLIFEAQWQFTNAWNYNENNVFIVKI